jgi:hypothetical protein
MESERRALPLFLARSKLSVGQNPRDQALSAVQQTAPVQASRPKRPLAYAIFANVLHALLNYKQRRQGRFANFGQISPLFAEQIEKVIGQNRRRDLQRLRL